MFCFFNFSAVNAELAAKPQVLAILPSISVILALQSVFLTSLLVSGIFFSNSDLSMSYLTVKINLLVSILFTFATNYHTQSFLTTSFFAT